MDNQRVLLAIILSLAILLGYNYLFLPPQPPPSKEPVTASQVGPEGGETPAGEVPALAPAGQIQPVPAAPPAPAGQPEREARDIRVDTNLYRAVITENGGGLKSLSLKKYREELAEESGPKELIQESGAIDLPLYFSFGAAPTAGQVPLFSADTTELQVTEGEQLLTLTTTLDSGIVIQRKMTFHPDSYLIDLAITLHNPSPEFQYQGAPFLRMVNRPFSANPNNRFLFNGPVYFQNDSLEEIKPGKLADEPVSQTGQFDFLGYSGTYFMAAIMPQAEQATLNLKMLDEERAAITLSEPVVSLPPGAMKTYNYNVYLGPKKMASLKTAGHNLKAIINFGWFDFLAKPMLVMLNWLYGYLHNYGWAIILLTVFIKLLFWPLSYKGMKSMKTMQKLQPKMAKLKEKYGDDRERMSRETMALYQTYKVNPVGGCMPMLLQIPVFFALYRLLMQTIELRHAPFMGWITDLSAPDRLFLGFELPIVGGLPVLTLLMGGSMFLQQKMTPAPADPTQAKVMMFLPVIFTFMFVNFASGLVLYWFVNNLLSIAQQYAINKAPD
ncbi:MAG: membrane protein insertase YidC [Thermodesulfobacteriota bacterium]